MKTPVSYRIVLFVEVAGFAPRLRFRSVSCVFETDKEQAYRVLRGVG